jgi:hypothetical protein
MFVKPLLRAVNTRLIGECAVVQLGTIHAESETLKEKLKIIKYNVKSI